MSRGYEYDAIRPIPKVFSDTINSLNDKEEEAFITYAENLEDAGVNISEVLSGIESEKRMPFIKASIAPFM